MRKGFTLVEVLVSVGIVAILIGLLTPVYKHAKRSAQIASTSSKLHNIQLATTLYRQKYDGDGVYGHIYAMGLPDAEMLSATLYDNRHTDFHPLDMYYSSCGFHPGDNGFMSWFPTTQDKYWTIPVLELEDAMPLCTDLNCNDADVAVQNRWQTKFGVAVTLGGWIVRKRKEGPVDDPYWWR